MLFNKDSYFLIQFYNESRDFVLNIYITRHGETKWNRENRLQGWKDSPLTKKGSEHAILLGKRLADIPFQTIYTSPSGRAVQTAKLIRLERDIPIVQEEGLKELNFGEWEGKTREEIGQINGKEYENFWTSPHKYDHRSHRGESLQDFQERIRLALMNIISDYVDGNILIVSHAVAIRAMLAFCLNLTTEKFWAGPFIQGTSLTIIKWDGTQFAVEKIGDMSHLDQ